MRLPTKTLASLLLVTAVAATLPGISQLSRGGRRRESQFDRLLQRHDRKGELRASVLGIEAADFRTMQKKMPFDEIARMSGFKNPRSFRLALLGKLKEELRHRGWSSNRIERFVDARRGRVS